MFRFLRTDRLLKVTSMLQSQLRLLCVLSIESVGGELDISGELFGLTRRVWGFPLLALQRGHIYSRPSVLAYSCMTSFIYHLASWCCRLSGKLRRTNPLVKLKAQIENIWHSSKLTSCLPWKLLVLIVDHIQSEPTLRKFHSWPSHLQPHCTESTKVPLRNCARFMQLPKYLKSKNG